MKSHSNNVAQFQNKLQKIEIAHRMHFHRRKVQELQAKQNNSFYPSINHDYKTLFDQNPKKHYLIEEKHTEIERQNRVLFQKLIKIKHKKQILQEKQEKQKKKSLNLSVRKRQIQQIQNQNAKFYNRLLNQKAFMSFKRTDKEFMRQRQMSERLSKLQKYKIQNWY